MNRVLHIIPSRSWGGGERYIYDLAQGTEERLGKGSVLFVGRESEQIRERFSPLGEYYALPLRFLGDVSSAMKLASIIDRHEVDILHVHIFKDAFIASLASSLSKRKPGLVMTRHLVKRGKRNMLYNSLYRRLDKMIFISQLALDEFSPTEEELRSGKVEVLHNSVRVPSEIRPVYQKLREIYSIPESSPLIGFTGRLSPEKGVEELIRSIALTSDIRTHAVVIGGGTDSYADSLRALAVELGVEDRVHFYGFAEDIYPLVVQMDMAVLPSIWREPFGLVLLECMACSKVVITTNNGAQPEIITSGQNGILVPPSDAEVLAEAIRSVVSDANLKADIERNARLRSQDFSHNAYVSRVLDCYNQALKSI